VQVLELRQSKDTERMEFVTFPNNFIFEPQAVIPNFEAASRPNIGHSKFGAKSPNKEHHIQVCYNWVKVGEAVCT